MRSAQTDSVSASRNRNTTQRPDDGSNSMQASELALSERPLKRSTGAVKRVELRNGLMLGRSRRSRQPLSGSGSHWSARMGWPIKIDSISERGMNRTAFQRSLDKKMGLEEVTSCGRGGQALAGGGANSVSP